MTSGGKDLTLREKCFSLTGEDLVNTCLSLAEECDHQQEEGVTSFSLTLPGASASVAYDSYETCGQAATGVSAAFDAGRLTKINEKQVAAKVFYDAATQFYDKGKFQDAVGQLEIAYDLFPKPAIRENIATTYRKIAETETDPREKAKAYYKAAHLWSQGGNYTEALVDARRADALVPNEKVKARIAELEGLAAGTAPASAVAPAAAEAPAGEPAAADPTQRVVKVTTVEDLPRMTAATPSRSIVIVMMPRSFENAQKLQEKAADMASDADIYVIDLDDATTTTQLMAGLTSLGVSQGDTPTSIRFFKRTPDQAQYVLVDGQLEPKADYAFTPINFGNIKAAGDGTTSVVLLVGDPLTTYSEQKKIRKAIGADVRYFILDPQQGGLVKMAEQNPPRGFGITVQKANEASRIYARAKGEGQTWQWFDFDEGTGKLKPVDDLTLQVAQLREDEIRRAERSRASLLYSEAKRLCDRGDFETAAQKYIEAHNIAPDSLYPWKIGECYARGGSLFQAIAFLRYHRDHYPRAGERAVVDQKLAELEARLPKNPPPGPQLEKTMLQVTRDLERRQREEAAKRALAAGGVELQRDILGPEAVAGTKVKSVPAAASTVAGDEAQRIVEEALRPAPAGPETAAEIDRTLQASAAMKEADDLFNRKRYDDALAQYDHAHNLDQRPAALLGKARCHQALNRRAEAIAAYRAYLTASPSVGNKADIEAVISALELPDQSPPPPSGAEAVAEQSGPPKPAPPATSSGASDASDPVAELVKRHTSTPDRFQFTYLDDANVATAGDLEGAIVVVGEPDHFWVEEVQQQLRDER
ncbi:MAG: tetratricopeptide repeat protein, partial [Deltaproteobacteria bacterium]|nr:tetratricopeptide repeat protein [Deltaproteobacteria bacterium]